VSGLVGIRIDEHIKGRYPKGVHLIFLQQFSQGLWKWNSAMR
jgi:hypothetical protein